MNDTVVLAVLSTNIGLLLERKGWSLRELARQTGDSVMTLQGLTSGNHLPRSGVPKRVADAFQISLDELYDPELKKNLKKNLSLAS